VEPSSRNKKKAKATMTRSTKWRQRLPRSVMMNVESLGKTTDESLCTNNAGRKPCKVQMSRGGWGE